MDYALLLLFDSESEEQIIAVGYHTACLGELYEQKSRTHHRPVFGHSYGAGRVFACATGAFKITFKELL